MYIFLMFAWCVIIAVLTYWIDLKMCGNQSRAGYYSRRKIEYRGLIGALAISFLVVFSVYQLSSMSMMRDVEILNGKVTSKQPVDVGCRHDYSCNCREECSSSGDTQSCSTVCDTCYEHSYDVDWDVYTTIGSLTIDPIDRQGLQEPPRWTQVRINEPVSAEHGYQNYIKASPQSLFNSAANVMIEFRGKLPAHPSGIYDYYRVNRLVLSGVQAPANEVTAWNMGIGEILKEIGPSKQVNVVVVLTNSDNSLWANALRTEWLGGKKNEVVVIIGTPQYPEISWVNVFSWSQDDMLNVKLRDDIRELKTVDRTAVLNLIYVDIVKHFKRKPMEDYKYLRDEIEPDLLMIMLAMLLGVVPFGVYLARERLFK